MSDKNPYVIGVCGRSGSGKSYISEMLSADLSSPWYDLDAVYHELIEPTDGKMSDCTAAVCEALGDDFTDERGNLDRKKLGKAVFSDKNKLEILNRVTHAFITDEIRRRLSECTSDCAVLDAVLLPFSPCSDLCDMMIYVDVSEATSLRRILRRDGIDRNAALSRLASQPADEEYKKVCDKVILNEGSVENEVFALAIEIRKITGLKG